MQFQKITLAIATVAASSMLACTGTHEASARSTSPEIPSRVAADTDTVVRSKVVADHHPTPPALDSLIKGTLPARGLYVFRFAANTRRLKHLIGIADSTEVNALIIDVKDEFGLNYNSSDPMG